MELFTTVDVIGQGLPLLLPKGTKMVMKLQRWIEDLEDKEWGYVRTKTPLMAKSDLYKISGHWDHYKEGMFVLGDEEKDKEVFALRPMTCPFQYYCYKNSQHSYRDLPIRYGETSTLFRNEDSGEMHGLTRVRQFTISEGHLVIRPDQAQEELKSCLDLAHYCLSTLGLEDEVTYRLSKWDPNNKEKYLGDEEYWESTQSKIREVLKEKGVAFTEADGEAAFYGPKIDIQAKNVYGKEDTMITIQLDCDQHIGKFRKSCLADLESDLFGTAVNRNINIICGQFLSYLLRIILIFLGNRKHTHLLRTQPCRELARIFFDQPC